ncbi:MAG: L-serine ammonia-lyase, iron-sulfur-dependent subunit beta [Acetobacterium sp.]
MDVSIFQVLGPVMIGPSSSHTAGAAKLARMAGMIANKPFSHVSFGLHGSFAKTYKGHGTDKALVAGVLAISEQDERLTESFELAQRAGISYDFYEADLGDVHENSVKFTFSFLDKTFMEVVGSSVGGGAIAIRKINDFAVNLSAKLPTVIIKQYDTKGVLSEVTKVLAENDINIATMNLSRTTKGDKALCIIESDSPVTDVVGEKLRRVKNVIDVMLLNLMAKEEDDV